MNNNTPTSFLVLSVLIFYARLFWVQRKKSQLEDKITALPVLNKGKKSTKGKKDLKDTRPASSYLSLSFHITNWWLAIGGLLFVIGGLVLRLVPSLMAIPNNPWWAAISIGIVMLGFSYW